VPSELFGEDEIENEPPRSGISLSSIAHNEVEASLIPHAGKHRARILDVTLRDGGYRNNWNFSQEDALELIELLTEAGLEWIEIGYRNCPPNEQNVGLTGRTPNAYIEAVRRRVPTAKLAVMYAPALITENDLVELAAYGVAMVRCSMPHLQPEHALALIARGHELGMISTANMTTVTQYALDDLIDLCKRVWEHGCDVIYVADSNGSMTPESVCATFDRLKGELPSVQWGFHNHNMLSMSMANAIEAMRHGVAYVDCSLRGMGRSAGNVPTEALLAYFSRMYADCCYDIGAVIKAALSLQERYPMADLKPTLADFAYGFYDFDSQLEPLIIRAARENGVGWHDLIAAMAEADLDKSRITLEALSQIARGMETSKNGGCAMTS
jgi:4-hydroxy 2-oxovalerate aldolase